MAKVLEVCVDSLASARAAIAGGADRLELCSSLTVGGLTPFAELLEQIRQESDIAVRCLMRPRAGDFLYSGEELDLLCRQILRLRNAGADGFVIGCLKSDGSLDKEAMKRLMEFCGGKVTLHRAMDVSRNLIETYEAAAELGIDTVLTSGGSASCKDGVETLRQLIALREETGGPEVLIGAGVNADVIRFFRKEIPGARAFHLSGKVMLESKMEFRREGVPMGLPGLDEWHIQQTDREAIRNARLALDEM